MPIEFHCTACNQLLRVPDDTAGRKAQCPGCDAVLDIPSATARPAPAEPPPAPIIGGSASPERDSPFPSPGAENTGPISGNGFGVYRDSELANRVTRFGGAIVDGLILAPAIVPIIIVTAIMANADPEDPESGLLMMAGIMLLCVLGVLAISIFQWYLISTTGQSIAKKLLGMRIVRAETGELPGFVYGVVLRLWVPAFIGMIPWIGGFFGLADALWIFGEQRRCVHDHIAGTIVIKV